MSALHPPAATRPGRPEKLAGIEAGRGIAALLVLGHHVRDHLYFNFHIPNPLNDFFIFGHAGVDFFFVLSGFIIFHVHSPDWGRPHRLRHYAERRFTRIYPFYWVALGAATLVAGVSLHHSIPRASDIVASALLLPIAKAPILSVAWTLQHEVVFYVVFSLCILNRPIGLTALLMWLAAILFLRMDEPAFGPLNMEFFAGMSAAWLLQRFRFPAAWAFILSGCTIFVATGLIENFGLVPMYYGPLHVGFATGATVLILGLVEAERSGKLAVAGIFSAFGDASYAIYLTHFLCVGAIWLILLRLHIEQVLSVWATFLVMFVIAAAAGVIISRFIEKPLIRSVRRLFSRAFPDRTTAPPITRPSLASVGGEK